MHRTNINQITGVIFMAMTTAAGSTAADLTAVDKTQTAITSAQLAGNLITKEGTWKLDGTTLQSTDIDAVRARTFVKGYEWIDCVFEATINMQLNNGEPWAGLGLILRGDDATDDFINVRFNAPQKVVTIEVVRNLQFTTLGSFPFKAKFNYPYRMKVVTDRAGIYCYIDGQYVGHAVEKKISQHPSGMVGFYAAAATGSFSDISVKPALRSKSPFTVYAGNPLNIDAYSPTVILDGDTYKMWYSSGDGQAYAESKDGITWTQPAGTKAVKPLGTPGTWGDFNEADADGLKCGDEYLMWHPAGGTINANWWDGMGLHRSKDGIHWTPEPGNPLLYMGPTGAWDENVIGDHSFIKDGNIWKMWYTGINFAERGYRNEFGYAESRDCVHWKKSSLSPVITQGEPGEWDSGWLSAAAMLKLGDEETQTRIYKGKSGASYHCFYHGHITNDEFVAGVKRLGWAFSLDGVNWVKFDDITTSEPPFQSSDPIVTWSDWGTWGHLGVRACSAVIADDEVKIWYSGEGCEYSGSGYASAKISDLLAIVEKAKESGKLKVMPRKQILATLGEPLPLSTWDDLADSVLQASTANGNSKQTAMKKIASMLQRMSISEHSYLQQHLAPLQKVVNELTSSDHQATSVRKWKLDISALGPPSATLHDIKYEGTSKGVASFTVTGNDPYIVLPISNLEVNSDGLNLLKLEIQVEKPSRDVRVSWSLPGKEDAGIVSRQIRFSDAQKRLCFMMPWKQGERVQSLKLHLPGAGRVKLKSASVYEVKTTK